MSKKKKNEMEDDGRVIAPMNVEGMPWYTPYKTTSEKEKQPLDKRESRQFMFSALLATLLIGSVFIVGMFLFILFSIHVWLR